MPRAIRFKPENIIIIVSTIPGPKEADYNHLNPYLKPMVDELLDLWDGVTINTPNSTLTSRLLRAQLSCISSDLPATRKLCGFYGYHANYVMAQQVKHAKTRLAHENAEKKAGVRYSDLLRLPYFDIIRCHLVDPMQNLFLGTSKRMISLWKENKSIVESNLDIL